MTKEPMVSRTVLMPVDSIGALPITRTLARFLGRRRCDGWWRRIFLMSEKTVESPSRRRARRGFAGCGLHSRHDCRAVHEFHGVQH